MWEGDFKGGTVKEKKHTQDSPGKDMKVKHKEQQADCAPRPQDLKKRQESCQVFKEWGRG